MSATIAHRGPDGSGSICSGPMGMTQHMLWSTPESLRERQPLIREATALCMVADARIDNRDELVSALPLLDHRACDGDIIIAAYERWGASCVDHLIGDFAFAIWDGRLRQLFCARDPMGVKPFYYFESPRLFAFASEAKALFALREVPRDIDPIQVALFVEGTVDDRIQTHYKAVKRLPAAHSLTIRADGVTLNQYWRPDVTRELKLSSSEEYAEAFRDIFETAVRARLRSVHPLGAALSGGLDSSSIVCMARQIQRDTPDATTLNTFSLVFPSLPVRDLRLIDERQYIDSVVRGGGVAPTYIRGDELSPVSDIEEILPHLDEPYAAPNLYLHWAMYRAMHARGARVFLDGFDGDTAVSHGFGRLNMLVRNGEWDVFEREVRALAQNRRVRPDAILTHLGLPYLALLARQGKWVGWSRAAREMTRRFDLSRRDTFLNHGLRAAIPDSFRTVYRTIRRLQAETFSVVPPAMAQVLRRRAEARGSRDDLHLVSTERESHVEGLSQPAYQLTLEMADKCAAVFGIEPRYPFFDRRLIDFCLALPESEKLAGGWPRLVFRRAMEGIVPTDIQWRSDKGNLSPNFHRALRTAPATAVEVESDSPLGNHVDLHNLREMRRRYREETSTLARSADGHTLFRTMVLERWLCAQSKSADPVSPRAETAAPVAA